MNKIMLDLEVKLKGKELEEKGQEMASAMLEYDDYEEEKKQQANELGKKMKELHAKLTGLAKITRRKTEVRPVECTVEFDVPEVGTKRIIRTDTKAIIKEMPMTVDERQTKLFPEDSVSELQKMFNLPSDTQPPPTEPPAPDPPAA